MNQQEIESRINALSSGAKLDPQWIESAHECIKKMRTLADEFESDILGDNFLYKISSIAYLGAINQFFSFNISKYAHNQITQIIDFLEKNDGAELLLPISNLPVRK